MSIFGKYKTNQAISRLSEEMLYAKVAEEIQRGIRRDGLWAKAISEAELNEDKAKAIYIKLRVQSLVDEINLSKEADEQKITRTKSTAELPKDKKYVKDKVYTKDSIGSSDRELTCINCNRFGKMLIKKTKMTLTEKFLFGWLGGIPGIMLASLFTEIGESALPLLFAIISYLIIYFILYNKNHLQCPNCGNIGEIR
jgi:hypothetical protein